MKKIMNLLISCFYFLKGIFLQTILGLIALYTLGKAEEFGQESEFHVGTYTKQINGEYIDVGTSAVMSSGFIGGAISMGIISSVCITMIVWIEVNKKK